MQTLESLKSIFKDRVFKIPDYQRGYSWQKRQLKDFWEDIVNLPNDRFHYTGLLSLKQVSRKDYQSDNWIAERWLINDRGFKPFHIVDGQQRLTTFVIFINEILNLFKSLPEYHGKTDSEIYIGTYSIHQIKEEYLVVQMPPQFVVNTYKFGYEKDNPSFDYLRHKVLGEPNSGSITETFYTLNLENAKQFFKDNLENYYERYGKSEVEVLFKKVTQNLMFNLHEIEDDFDVFVAFETMNNRGKKLSNLELLKNRLIYLTTLYEPYELSEDERTILRGDINNAWKEVYYQLGRNKKNPLSDDDFLTAHWIMYFQYTRQKGDDYIKFLLDEKFTPQNVFNKIDVKLDSIADINEIRDTDEVEEVEDVSVEELIKSYAKLAPKEISDYVKSLQSAAVHWYNTFNPLNNSDLWPEEHLWLDRLNRIGIAYFRPLVVASYIRTDIDTMSRVNLFKEIERFIFIAFRLGRALSTYRNSEYYKLTKQLTNGKITVDEICTKLKERIEGWLSPATSFDIQPFKTYIARHYKNGGGFYWWNGLQYFLFEYENDKVIQNGNPKIDWNLFVKSEKDKVSIEHIYPQTPSNSYWINSFSCFTDEQKSLLTGSLGNLLPLSQSKNASMQNDSFPEKVSPTIKSHKGYRDGSHSEIEVAAYPDWNAKAILQRGNKLIEFMEKRWGIKFEDDESKKEFLFLNFM
ncbi:DUF262 domain-containing protein [Bacillus sp. RG28]|uniref:DUF262 domain-containing protein n=1 Tax=Gottfriedia endophytica TaxID=2820819 RepID=A0A940SHX7_9BACI|nr:DUF262 domain-containing protein [Gottfriedia endophytica]MBP0723931.1 DUF262 domain-containing protein [Gottfriedia endophytica]